jgi:hypothetical protein
MLKKCPRLRQLAMMRPVKDETKAFLQKSQCGYHDRAPYVCCAPEPETTTTSTTVKPSHPPTPRPTRATEKPTEPATEVPETITLNPEPEWLQKLRKMVPQAPHCGIDAKDRIFGGKEAKLNEYPWLALLNYDKGLSTVILFSTIIKFKNHY